MANTAENIVLNVKAKEYVPKKKKTPEEENKENTENNINNNKEISSNNINFNLDAKEFVPKQLQNIDGYLVNDLEDDEEDEVDEDDVLNDLVNQELEDPMQLDDEESDEDKWFPKYKDCSCCNGYIYKCSGDVCTSLGVCFCKAQEDYDPDV